MTTNITKYVNDNYVKMSSREIWKLFDNREDNKELIVRTQLPQVLKKATDISTTTGKDIEELFSIGLETLVKCIDSYDLDRKRPFISYLEVCLTNDMIDYVPNTITISNYLYKQGKAITTSATKMDYEIENIGDSEEYEEKDYSSKVPVEIINKYCTKYQAHVIIEKLGITGATKEIKHIAKETGKSNQNIQMLYNKGIERIRKGLTT